jgi:hypothetical protein
VLDFGILVLMLLPKTGTSYSRLFGRREVMLKEYQFMLPPIKLAYKLEMAI